MPENKKLFRRIDYSIDSCPPELCPINEINPHTEFCCGGCNYQKIIGDYEDVFCDYPDSLLTKKLKKLHLN